MDKKIIKGAFILSMAPVITQLFSFIILPIISRIYAPEDLGIYATIASAAGVISVMQGLGYHQAIVLPKSGRIAQLIFNLCIVITLCLSLSYFIFIYFVPENLIYFPKVVLDFKYPILIMVLLEGFYLCLLSFNIRNENFKVISFSRVLRVFTNKFTILFLGLFVIVSPSNFVYADIFASCIVCVILFLGIKKHVLIQNFDFELTKSILYKYRQFPIYNMPTDIIFRLKEAVINFLILNFFTAQVVGYYSMALLILTIPTTFIGASISEVFYKEAASYKFKEKLQQSTLDLFFTLLSSSLVIFVVLALYGESLILFFLGNDWTGVSIVISALVISSFNNFILSPFMNILKVIEKQKFNVIYQVTSIIFSVVALWVGAKYESFFISFMLYSLVNLIIGTVMVVTIFKMIKIKFNSVIINTGVIFINVIPVISIFFIYNYFYQDTSIYFDLLLIILSIYLNYYLNFKLISSFRSSVKYLILNRLFNLWEKKL
ncbi:oligosaccharide flippase family protein [Flavobacteriaceae bacterium]|nr:oligosaccharide flippase family protein [Flavobacteriaceae bacterium]